MQSQLPLNPQTGAPLRLGFVLSLKLVHLLVIFACVLALHALLALMHACLESNLLDVMNKMTDVLAAVVQA